MAPRPSLSPANSTAGITTPGHRRGKPHYEQRTNLGLSKICTLLPACTCDAGVRIAAHKEKEKVHQFLIKLNPEFSTIRSQILSMEPLLNASRAHSMAAHDEAQRLIAQERDSSSEVVGFAAKIVIDSRSSNPNFGPNRGDFKPRGRLFCDFCRRNGHHRATCYQLHGYLHSDQSNQWSLKGNPSGQSRYRGKNRGAFVLCSCAERQWCFRFRILQSGAIGQFQHGLVISGTSSPNDSWAMAAQFCDLAF
ncbi:hypothetical protein CRG98_041282 [Punica granatum]|uniref:Uncharacterized protein n=1 Tax=Punica granatum TaxID=22663 RepID=A0A2I0I2V7_PUNGR|nr:hypothetical protein CRG98_041282 [Punica granatum]